MDEIKLARHTPAWLLTADRYVAEVTRDQRLVARWRAATRRIEVGQALPRPALAPHVGWLDTPASSLPQ